MAMTDDNYLVRMKHDCLKNTARLSAMGLCIGSFLAYHESHNPLNPITDYTHQVGRGLVRLALPCAFGFGVFGATTCMLDNVRGKDKALSNALIGGFCGGFCGGTRVHEPKYSLILGSSMAVLAFGARLMSTNFMMDDRAIQLQQVNETLDMRKIAHLDPYKAKSEASA